MTRDDDGTTNGTDRESPSRKDILDGVSGRRRGGLADMTESARAGSTGPTASRRSVLATTGAIGAAALSGCLGALTGETAEFNAPPALLSLPSLEERRDNRVHLEMAPMRIAQARDTVRRFGLSREAVVTGWGATYGLTADVGETDGGGPGFSLARTGERAVVGEEVLVSVPKVEIAGQSLVDPGDLTVDEILERIGRGGRHAGADGPTSEDGLIQGAALDIDSGVGTYLRNLYGGTVAGISEAVVSPDGARNLDESASRPLLFGATVRRLIGGGEARIVGAVQRFELEDAYVFRASTRAVPEGSSQSAARIMGATGEEGGEMTMVDVGDIGDGGNPIHLGGAADIDDYPPLKTCLQRREDCIGRCYDRYDSNSDDWGDCLNACPTCGHLPPYGVIVGADNAPRVDADLVAVCPPTTVDASACVGDIVQQYAEHQVSEWQRTG